AEGILWPRGLACHAHDAITRPAFGDANATGAAISMVSFGCRLIRNRVNNWNLRKPLLLQAVSDVPHARHDARKLPSQFGQKGTANHPRILGLIHRVGSPEFIMSRCVVIVVAAMAWIANIERAEAKLDILVDKATQRMIVIQDGFIRHMWPVST